MTESLVHTIMQLSNEINLRENLFRSVFSNTDPANPIDDLDVNELGKLLGFIEDAPVAEPPSNKLSSSYLTLTDSCRNSSTVENDQPRYRIRLRLKLTILSLKD